MGVSYTTNFNLTKGRVGVPRIHDANMDIIDEELCLARAYPYVPNQPRPATREFADNAGVEQRQKEFAKDNSVGIDIKSLEVGAGLVLRDQGDGAFIIELAPEYKEE